MPTTLEKITLTGVIIGFACIGIGEIMESIMEKNNYFPYIGAGISFLSGAALALTSSEDNNGNKYNNYQ